MKRITIQTNCNHDDVDNCDEARYVCHCGVILEFHYDFIPNGEECMPDDGEWEIVGHVDDKGGNNNETN